MRYKDLLIGRPVLEYLGVDTSTLLDQNRKFLHEQDCLEVGNPTAIANQLQLKRVCMEGEDHQPNRSNKSVGNNALSDHNRESDLSETRVSEVSSPTNININHDSNLPRESYYNSSNRDNSFPDESLLDCIDNNQSEDVQEALDNLLAQTRTQNI